MKGIIGTAQKCPACGVRFPSSRQKGIQADIPIFCRGGCQTQPTKYYIKVYWKGNDHMLFHDRSGRTMHHWNHAVSAIGAIREAMENKTFNPSLYKKQAKSSFKKFWAMFEADYKGATLDKISAIGRHHVTYFEPFQMRDIETWNIKEWWQGMEAKGLSPAYLNDIMTWVKTFFLQAVDLEIIEKMPKFPKSISVLEPEVDDYHTQIEQDLVIEHIPECDKPIIKFLTQTGCRVNEACGLLRADTDWQRGVTIIKHTVKRDKSIGPTKNKKKRRIPHVADIRKCLLASNVISTEYQFINKWGRRYHAEYLRRLYKDACVSAGIKPIALKNATRHSAGMRLISQGWDLESVRKFLGHSTTRMTLHYAKVMDEQIELMYEGKEMKVE